MEIISSIGAFLSDYVLVVLLLIAAIYFTFATRGVQFRMAGQMIKLLVRSGNRDHGPEDSHHSISSFQAFAVSIASRVGTGNLAGVASAIALGGPGSIFWMWVIAVLGAATAFVESTLAQLYKVKGKDSFLGGPAYYILHGIHKRWWAVTFAILITLTFGLAFTSVQSNTIAGAFSTSFGIPSYITGGVLTILTLIIIFGGIQSIARFSQWVVPIFAIAYIIVALVIVCINITHIPHIFQLIIDNAFGVDQALVGTVGAAMTLGIKRGLFSNEAGEGSAPNVAATASVSHPAKQGLIQSLGVYTDTLLICSCTAFIILCSGVWNEGHEGIVLTQHAIDIHLGLPGIGASFISVAIFFFAFTSIVANYYYGETNLRFIMESPALINLYRLCVGAIVMVGSVASLNFVWSFADVTMALMTICNLAALTVLGKFAIMCLRDYQKQLRAGIDPVYRASTIPEIARDTPCW